MSKVVNSKSLSPVSPLLSADSIATTSSRPPFRRVLMSIVFSCFFFHWTAIMKVGPLMEFRADIDITGMQDVSNGGRVAASPGAK